MKRILILGGGFGGVYTALTLEKLLGDTKDVEIALVSRENYIVFQPMLPEVISGSIGLVDTITPIAGCARARTSTRGRSRPSTSSAAASPPRRASARACSR